jgi:flagellar hook-associated protein 1 FlgK
VVSLFGSLNVGELSLRAHSVALQTTGQNIANASNKAFHRQRVMMGALPGLDRVYYQLGTGVQVERVERVVDQALATLIRDAKSGLGELGMMRNVLVRLESVFNEFSDSDLSTVLGKFWASLEDLSIDVADSATRRGVVLAGQTLSDTFHFFGDRMRGARREANDRVLAAVGDINRITAEIAELNRHISLCEDGGLQNQDANDLRDRRDALVEELSEYVLVKTSESSTGMLQVYSGSDFLVFDSNAYALTTKTSTDDGVVIDTVLFEQTGAELNPRGGKLHGMLEARDATLPGYLGMLDEIANTLIYEFNKIHSTGRGLEGYTAVVGTSAASDPAAALNASGLPFDVLNGSFNISVRNETTGAETTTNIKIDLTGTGIDTTLSGLASTLDGVTGVSATVTADGKLSIASDDSNTTFTFSDDTSGALAALGVGAFFTGHDVESMGVSDLVSGDVKFLAGGLTDAQGDNSNVLRLIELRNEKVLDGGTASIEEYYQSLIGKLGTESAYYQDRAANQQVLTDQMLNERQAVSGVSLDEEAVNLIQYQHAFQASARFISVISQMMDVLMNM